MNEWITTLHGNLAGHCGTVLLMVLACCGCGKFFLRRICPGEKGMLVSLTLGGVLLAFWGLIGGAWLVRCPAWAAAVVPGLWAVAGLKELKNVFQKEFFRRNWDILAGLLLLGTWFFASAEIPPYSWDEQTYQIAVPSAWIRTGSIAPAADLPYSAFPLMPQFLLLQFIRIGGLGTAKFLILGAFLLLGGGLWSEIRATAGRGAAWIFTAVFFLSQLTGSMIREFYAEVFLALPLLAAVRLARTGKAETCGGAVLFGILAGGAAAVKLTGAGTAFAIALLFGLNKPKIRAAAWFAASAAAVAFPFYLRPWMVLGNPVYPFFGVFFGSNSGWVDVCHRAMGEVRYGPGRLYGAVFGWIFTACEGNLYDGITLGWAFPLIFAVALAGGVLLWRRGEGRTFPGQLAAACVFLYVFWAASSQQTRFMLPLFPVFLLLCAVISVRWKTLARRTLWGVIAVLELWSTDLFAWSHGFYAWGYLRDVRKCPARVLQAATGEKDWVEVCFWLEKHAPADAKVLLIFEKRSLYCPRLCRNGSPGFQDWFDYTRYPDWIGELRNRGIRYIVLGSSRKNPDSLEMLLKCEQNFSEAVYQAFRTGRLHPVSVPGSYVLARIPEAASALP